MKCVHLEEGKRCDKDVTEGRIYCTKHEPKDGPDVLKASGSGGSRGGGDILFNIPFGGGGKTDF